MDLLLLLRQCLNTVLVGSFLLLTIIFILNYLQRKPKSSSKAKPTAVAKGAWPILGHLPKLFKSKLPHVTLGAMADEYGPIFKIWLGSRPAVVISNCEIARECFTTNDAFVSSRPIILGSTLMGYNRAMFVFAKYGPYWREMRKITHLELLSNRRVESIINPILVSEVNTSIKELNQLWIDGKTKKASSLVDFSIDLRKWLGGLTLNVVLKIIIGKRYFGNTEDCNDAEAERCYEAMREFFHLLGVFPLGDAVPWLRWLDFGGHEKAMKRTAKELDAIMSGWLEDHKRKRGLMGESNSDEEEDFMDVILKALDGRKIDGYDKDTIAKATCLTVIAGGSDTTMVTMTWAVSLLLNKHEVLKKVQEELDTQVGKRRLVTFSDINNLMYLQAVVKETLRLYPAAPLSGVREVTEDCIIGCCHVSKGTRLIPNLWKIQTDPRNWSNPLDFNIERFLTTHKDIDVRGKHFELIPFSSGRRACPGISFGLQLVHFLLARLLQAFDLRTIDNSPVDMSISFGLTIMKEKPLQVALKPRLPNELYFI